MRDRVALFARAPVLGQVKTRLAQSMGAAAALAAHERLVHDALLRLTGDPGYSLEFWIAGDTELPAVQRWRADFGVATVMQTGGDLGERMALSLRDMLGRSRKALVVGCDCPDIDRAYVNLALAYLENSDVVLGPAEDGGYGLIGARGAVPDLFSGIPWGGGEVLSATLAVASALALRVALLPTIWDVDTLADWERYCATS